MNVASPSAMRSPSPAAAAPITGLPVVHLVDDEPVVREALGWLLRTRRLLSEAHPSAEAFERMLLSRGDRAYADPACLLLDIRMPGLSGIELFDRLVARGVLPLMPVIFLTGHGDVPLAVATLKKGAFDFFEKPLNDNELVTRIEEAMALDARQRAANATVDSVKARISKLTTRERQIMELVVAGKFNKVIADELNISMRTVEVHRANLFDKMQVKTAVELANLLKSGT